MSLKILATLDGSVFSEGILASVGMLARQAGAQVYLLRVIPPAHDRGQAGPNYDPTSETAGAVLVGHQPEVRVRELETVTQAAERTTAEARDYLAACAHRLEGAPVECLVRDAAHPAQEIVRCAEELGADMIAMATHGRTGLSHVLAGSVAEAVVRTATVPVLLMRPAR